MVGAEDMGLDPRSEEVWRAGVDEKCSHTARTETVTGE